VKLRSHVESTIRFFLVVEPFFGAGHVLMRRPHAHQYRTETINDFDGFVANFWRALQKDPEQVAKWAGWPTRLCGHPKNAREAIDCSHA
jgi:site-specific DNA-adenine methylase